MKHSGEAALLVQGARSLPSDIPEPAILTNVRPSRYDRQVDEAYPLPDWEGSSTVGGPYLRQDNGCCSQSLRPSLVPIARIDAVKLPEQRWPGEHA